MYVRLVRFALETGKRSVVDNLAHDLGPAIRSQKGFHSVTFFGDDTDGEYGLFVLWESREDADAARNVIGPRLSKHLAGNLQGATDIRLFEVIEG